MENETPDDKLDRHQALTSLWQDWRDPPREVLALLPKVTQKDGDKSRCRECGGWLPPHIHLDYMGHADVTEALLKADPMWNWHPMGLADDGTPAIGVRDGMASLWILLTIHGQTRIGVGTCAAGKSEVLKELIGDAIRNAAMRFGIAVHLWSKAEGQGGLDGEAASPGEAPQTPQEPRNGGSAPQGPDATLGTLLSTLTPDATKRFQAWMKERGLKLPFRQWDDETVTMAMEYARALQS